MTPKGKKEIRQAIADAVREAVALAYEDAAKIMQQSGDENGWEEGLEIALAKVRARAALRTSEDVK
jgi:hypothetical protein